MKRNYIILSFVLAALTAGAVEKQSYTEKPDYFPEAFTMDMTRTDYRGTDDAGEAIAVNAGLATVEWNPNYINGSECYGKLTISDFYSNDCLQNTATLEFTNEQNRNFVVSEDGKQITFSFTGYFFAMARTDAPYSSAFGKASQYALLASARDANNDRATRYWMDGEYLGFVYSGGSALNCVLDLENKTITIDHAWGAFMTKDQYGASPSYVLEYFNKSVFEEANPTAITDINARPQVVNDDAFYSISGQRVLNPAPGIYIHNGKKIIVR